MACSTVATATTKGRESPPSQSFWQAVPWTGIVSLAVMIACAAAAAVVVCVSNGRIIDTWGTQPAVVLAIISAVSNIAFGSALGTGVAVRFWLSASRGALLSQMHYIWDHGRGLSFVSAIRAGSEARAVALLATAAYVTQFASAPLLQRSVHQEVKELEYRQLLGIDLATRIPDGWFGNMENDNVTGFLNGIPMYQAVWRNDSMRTRTEEASYLCNGTCHGYVKGAGLAHRCSSSQHHLDTANINTNDAVVFAINATRAVNLANRPYLLLTTIYASDVNASCITTITVDTCSMDAAVVEYPVTIQNSTITLRHSELTAMHVVSTYTSDLDLPNRPNGSSSGPLGGLGGLIGPAGSLYAMARKKFRPELNRTVYWGETELADVFLQVQGPAYADDKGPMRKCALTYSSPTDFVLRYMHEFMFRSALRTGNGTERQELDTHRVVMAAVFSVDARYLGTAIAAMAAAILLVAVLMRGWWRLGRAVTLSPLETAGALGDVPELRNLQPDATLKQILKQVDVDSKSKGPGVASVRDSAVDTCNKPQVHLHQTELDLMEGGPRPAPLADSRLAATEAHGETLDPRGTRPMVPPTDGDPKTTGIPNTPMTHGAQHDATAEQVEKCAEGI